MSNHDHPYRMSPAQPRPVARISGPADLITAIPYLLGFTPEESVVLVGLTRNRVELTVRVDIADGAEAYRHALAIALDSVTTLLLAIYTERPVPTWLRPPESSHDALVVRAGRWRSLLCTDPGCCPPDGHPLPDAPSVVATQLTVAGRAPLPTRAALVASVHPAPEPDPDATRETALLTDLSARDAAWFGLERQWARGDDLRDAAAHYLHLARHCRQDRTAAPAWFLCAWAHWRAGDSVRAGVAVDHALRLDPDYRAAQLLLHALRFGLPPSRLPTLAPANPVEPA